MKIPDWDFWLDLDQVAAWQAVSLSVNIDPDTVKFNRERYSISPVIDADIANLFSKRSRKLEPRIMNDFKTRGLVIGAGTLGIQISLRDFAGWAKNRNWEIPKYLSDVAQVTLPLTQAIVPLFIDSQGIKSESISDELLNYEDSFTIKPIENNSEQLLRKIPRTAIGKLAVKAALQLEDEFKRSASANEVLNLLKNWATEGTEPDTLIRWDSTKKGVIWLTNDRKEKSYDINACKAGLKAWRNSPTVS